LLVLVVVAVFIYGSRLRGRRQRETFVPAEEVEAAAETVGVEEVAVVPEREPEVEAQPEAEPEPSSAEVVPVQPAASNPEVARLIDEAMALMDANPSGIIKARDMLNEALPMAMGEKKQLSWLADKWLFSRSVFPQDRLCSAYRVKRGDQLGTIGRQFKVPYEILKEINNIARAEALRAGEPIKVIQGPFNARVYRSSFTMDLYLQNTFVRSFSVGLGKPGMETPTGLWVVKPAGKLIKPVWTDPITGKTYHPEDRDYPLGSRWIGLAGVEGEAKGRTGFAIHGTKKPEEIGTAGSQGCIRLHNGDVVLVYKLLMPGVSQVEVVE
jgi:hypothetical protein